MTSTWWRRSRWTVGSSRITTSAAWATASATSTSWRSPSDSSRTSRPTSSPSPTQLDRLGDGRAIGGPRATQRILVGQPAERHHLLDPHRERQHGLLRNDRDAPREPVATDRLERLAVDRDATRFGRLDQAR